MLAPLVLLTDFGNDSAYVGQMKGVLTALAPGHPLIDLTHAVSPQDIREGAFLLEISWRYFPPGSIFIAVVDPGVGTTRAPLAVFAEDRFFVGPDNGLITGALPHPVEYEAVRLEEARYRLPQVSATFHGRDLFAPAGAALAGGTALRELGSVLPSLVALPRRFSHVEPRQIEGRVIHIDRFGNLVSDISREIWERWTGDLPNPASYQIECGSWYSPRLCNTYADAEPGEILALFGSAGYLEIAVNGGSAAETLAVGRGEFVIVRRGA